MRRGVKLALLICAFAGLAGAQSTGQRSPAKTQSELKTFVSSDGLFQFAYPATLIQCEPTPGVSAADRSSPQECSAYFPVCDDGQAEGQTTLACLAYPRDKFTDTRTFEAAAFSVSVDNVSKTESACVAGSSDSPPRKIQTLQGVKFASFESSDAGMNQGVTRTIFRAFHQSKCYQLEIAVATANAQIFDPPVREFSVQDRSEVNRRLEQARDSFRFLQ